MPGSDTVREGLARLLCDMMCGETHLCFKTADAILARYIVLTPEERDQMIDDAVLDERMSHNERIRQAIRERARKEGL